MNGDPVATALLGFVREATAMPSHRVDSLAQAVGVCQNDLVIV